MSCIKYIFPLISIVAAQVAHGQSVPASAQRVVTLDLARTLLTTTPVKVEADDVMRKNPFGPRVIEQSEPAQVVPVAVNVTSDRDVLVNVIDGITPSGTMMLGGSPILLFREKKFKVGDFLPIVFQGKSYELEIASIERTNFTLRLNKEEITRPIKTVNKP